MTMKEILQNSDATVNQDGMNIFQQLRARTNRDQKDFAAKIGIPYKTWQNWEQGRSEPHPLSKETVLDKARKVTCLKKKP